MNEYLRDEFKNKVNLKVFYTYHLSQKVANLHIVNLDYEKDFFDKDKDWDDFKNSDEYAFHCSDCFYLINNNIVFGSDDFNYRYEHYKDENKKIIKYKILLGFSTKEILSITDIRKEIQKTYYQNLGEIYSSIGRDIDIEINNEDVVITSPFINLIKTDDIYIYKAYDYFKQDIFIREYDDLE